MGDEIERAADRALEADREDGGLDRTAEVEMHEDRTRENLTPGFARMRHDWRDQDARVIRSIMGVIDNQVMIAFADAYQIMNDLYEIVRTPKVDPATGEVLTDRFGWPVWEQNESGRYIEDYSLLGHKERETFLYAITTRMFDWEQRAAESWAEAMFAKAQWEERFAITFVESPAEGRRTDEARTQRARIEAREERYFALFQSAISRKTDAIVRSMERLSLRLSQSMG